MGANQLLPGTFAKIGGLSLKNGIIVFSGTGAPTNGVAGTGAGKAGPGSIYIRTSNGATYSNTNTKASPTWTQLGSVAALANGKIFVGGAGGAAAEQTPSGDVTMTNAGVFTLAGAVTKYAEVTISAADIVSTDAGKFGHAQGYPLVAAPVAGSVLELESAVLIYDFDTAAYTAGGNITVNWAGGGAAITGLVSAANSVGAAADKLVSLLPLATAGNAMSTATGLNLVAAAAFTQPGTAAGVLRVKVCYRLHTTGL